MKIGSKYVIMRYHEYAKFLRFIFDEAKKVLLWKSRYFEENDIGRLYGR